jgi:hypothetical protein
VTTTHDGIPASPPPAPELLVLLLEVVVPLLDVLALPLEDPLLEVVVLPDVLLLLAVLPPVPLLLDVLPAPLPPVPANSNVPRREVHPAASPPRAPRTTAERRPKFRMKRSSRYRGAREDLARRQPRTYLKVPLASSGRRKAPRRPQPRRRRAHASR